MAIRRNADPGSEDWPRFSDWLQGGLGQMTDWTVVAKTCDYGRSFVGGFDETLATFSFLVDPREVSLEEIFSNTSWDLHADFESIVDRPSKDHSGEMYVDVLREGVRHPLVQFRNSIGDYSATWRVWPALEDYFNLRRAQSGDLVDPYTGTKVVEMPEDAHNDPVRIRTDYLREYLSARRMILIRQHDHKRFWRNPIVDLGQISHFWRPSAH